MDLKRIYELLNIERTCVMNGNECDRNCKNCELVQDDKELILMYDILIMMIGSLLPKGGTYEIERNN